MTYFVVFVVVVDSEVLDDAGGADLSGAGDAEGVVVDDDVSVRVVVVSLDVVPGDADGAGAGVTRSRSVTRSERSVQPATSPAPSTRAQTPVSNFCIVIPPRWIRTCRFGVQRGCRREAVEVRSIRVATGSHRTVKESSR
jgi:hypothetical protein